jgi:hypothetical protein
MKRSKARKRSYHYIEPTSPKETTLNDIVQVKIYLILGRRAHRTRQKTIHNRGKYK